MRPDVQEADGAQRQEGDGAQRQEAVGFEFRPRRNVAGKTSAWGATGAQS
jgi:hypothetical protein